MQLGRFLGRRRDCTIHHHINVQIVDISVQTKLPQRLVFATSRDMKNSHLLKERVGVHRWANYELFHRHMVKYYSCQPKEIRCFWRILKHFKGAKKCWNTTVGEVCIKVCVLPCDSNSKVGPFLK